MDTVTFLHLSDLHFQPGDEHSRKIVLDTLWKDVRERKRIDPELERIDFIVFTGDIAYHGAQEEYELAYRYFFEPLLECAGLSWEKLWVVPGNHDINRNLVTPGAATIVGSLREREQINRLLETPLDRDLVLARLEPYQQFFVQRFPERKLCDMGWFHVAEHRIADGRVVAILGLNSAWLAYGDEMDQGKLFIGEHQVTEALERVKHAEICIALMHHPLSWLRESDDTRGVKHLLQQQCHLILHGHLHHPDVIRIDSLAGQTIIIPAGAVYDVRKSPNGYNLVKLDLEKATCTVYIRWYNDQLYQWQRDTGTTGDDLSGQVSCEIPGFLKRKPPLPSAVEVRASDAILLPKAGCRVFFLGRGINMRGWPASSPVLVK